MLLNELTLSNASFICTTLEALSIILFAEVSVGVPTPLIAVNCVAVTDPVTLTDPVIVWVLLCKVPAVTLSKTVNDPDSISEVLSR